MGDLADSILGKDTQPAADPFALPATPTLGTSKPLPAPEPKPKQQRGPLARLIVSDDAAARLKLAVDTGSKTPAEQSAKVLDLQLRTGLPVDLIERNTAAVAQAADQKDFDPHEFMATSPVVGRWLAQNPTYASVAQHDLDHLSLTEALLKSASEQYNANTNLGERVWNDVRQGWLNLKQTVIGLAYEPAIKAGVEAKQTGNFLVGYGPAGLPIYASQTTLTAEQQQQAVATAEKVGHAAAIAMAKHLAPIQAEIASIPKRPATVAALNATNWHDTLKAFSQDPLGVLADVGITSTTQQLPALALTVATRSPVVAAAAMGANSYAMELGNGVIGYLNNKGIDTTDPKAIIKALNDPAVAAAAVRYGESRAAIVSLLDAASGGLASKTLVPEKLVKHAIGRELANILVAQPVAQGTLGAIGEAGGQLITQGKITQPGQVFAEFAGEFTHAPLESVTFAGKRVREHLQATREAAKVRQAADTTDTLNALDKAAAATKMRETSPAQYEQLVKEISGESQIDTVYVPVEQWAAYYQTQNADPAAAAEAITGNPQAYTDAQVTGDVAIPIEKYASRIAGTEAHQALADDVKFNPDDMTLREAREFETGKPELVDQLLKEVGTDETADTSGPVYQDVLGKLMGAGVDKTAAAQQASLIQSVFRTLGNNTGVDPLALYQRYGLTVERQLGAAPQTATGKLGQFLQRLFQGRKAPEAQPTLKEALADRGITGDRQADALDLADELKAHGAEISPDGQVTLYHRTTPEAADAIVAQGHMTGKEDRLFFSTRPDGQAEGYGEAAIGVTVPIEDLQLDDVFNDEAHVTLKAGRPGNKIPLAATRLFQPAFHGSPHRFDKFSLEAIGTGEGAQAYGWGLYFAGKREIAEFYRDQLAPAPEINELALGSIKFYRDGEPVDYSPRGTSDAATAKALLQEAVLVDQHNIVQAFERDGKEGAERAVLGVLDDLIEQYEGEHEPYEDYYRTIKDRVERGIMQPVVDLKADAGNVYQVDLPNDDELLDWDKPFSDQPDGVQEKLKTIGDFPEDRSGKSIYMDAGLRAQRDDPNHYGGMSPYQAASEFLNSAGIPGLRYLDATSRNAGEGSYNYVIWDDSRVTVEAVNDELRQARELQQTAEDDGLRGKIEFSPERNQFRITLLEKADLTTFLHESGHFYLEVVRDLIDRGEASEAMQADWQTIKAFVGAKDDELTTEQHETFARAFESYLGEGKAPSPELTTAFAHFKQWLLSVYKALTRLNVTLTDDVRGVFDRLLASSEEIEAAQRMQDYRPIFESAEAAGMSAEQFAAYQRHVGEATEQAQAELAKEAMAEAERAQKAWYRQRRAEVRAQVAADFDKQPVWRALYFLQHGTLPDGSVPDGAVPVKLSREALVETYGEDILKRLPRPYVYTREGGVSPETVAPMFGFANGDDLVFALESAGNRNQAIDAETQRRLDAEYGDLRTDGTIAQKALDAVHNDKRLAVMLAEQRALDRLAGRKRTPSTRQVVKAAAKQLIGAKRLVDIQPNRYRVAEAKAAKQAYEAALKQDYEAASLAKSRELLNHELYRAARAALEQAEKARKYLAAFNKPSRRERLGKAGADYLDQMDALLASYEFRRVPLKRLNERESLAEFLRRHERDVQPIERPKYADDPADALNAAVDPQSANLEALRAEVETTNWRQLTPDELQGVRDNAALIWHLAKLKDSLLQSRRYKDLQDAADTVSASIHHHANRTVTQTIQSDMAWNKTKRRVAEYLAQSRRVPTFVAEMDGGEAGGALWGAYVRPLNEATNDYTVRMHAFSQALAKLYDDHYTKAEQRRMLSHPQTYAAINTRLTKDAVLAMALNWGNATNRERLMNGDHWTEQQVQSVLSTLDARDWRFVQAMWDQIDSYWPDFAANHQALFGIPPEKVQGDIDPVLQAAMDAHDVDLKGGYYPIAFDPQRSTVTDERALSQEGRRFSNPKSRTRAGAAHSRVSGLVAIPLRLTVAGVVQAHVSDVIHHIAYDQTLLDVAKILHHADVRDAIINHYGKPVFDRFNRLLMDIKWGTKPAENSFEQFLNHVRNGASVAGMAFSVTTTLLQPLGLSNSIAQIGSTWVAKGIARMGHDAAHFQNAAAWAMSQSDFMRYRRASPSREIGDVLNRIRKRGWRTKLDVAAFWMIANMQFAAVDLPTWYGAYEKAQSAGVDHDTAVQMADQAVRDAQGGGELIDQTEFQRGGPVIKLFTNFISYVAATYSLQAQKFRTTDFHDPAQILNLAKDTLLLMVVPAIGSAMLDAARLALTGDDDELRERTKKDWAEIVALEVAGMATGPFIGARDLMDAIRGYSYEGPAGLTVFGDTSNFIIQLKQGDADAAFWRSLTRTSGVLLHLPATQIDRAARGAEALYNHDTDNPMVLLFGPPPKQ